MKRQHALRIVFGMVCIFLPFSEAYSQRLNSAGKEKLEAFLRFVWKPIPKTLDITFDRKRLTKGYSKDRIIREVTEAHRRTNRAKGIDQNRADDESLQKEIQHVLSLQGKEKQTRVRIQIDGDFYRFDQSTTTDAKTFQLIDTFINGTYLDDGTCKSIHYNHKLKQAKQNLRSHMRFKEEKPAYFLALGFDNVAALKSVTKRDEGSDAIRSSKVPDAVLDENKLKHLINGGSSISFTLERAELNGQTVDKLSMYMKPFEEFPRSVFYVDPVDVTKIHKVNVYNASNGLLLTTIQCKHFDESRKYSEHGIPEWYREEFYDENGAVYYDELELVSIKINKRIDKAVFAFNPPPGYTTLVDYPEKVVVTKPPRQQAVSKKTTPKTIKPPNHRRQQLGFYAFIVIAAVVGLSFKKKSRSRKRTA